MRTEEEMWNLASELGDGGVVKQSINIAIDALYALGMLAVLSVIGGSMAAIGT